MAKTKKKPNFLAQGGILAIAGIISRIIGMLYRIPLMNIIGESGSGVYSAAYDIYNIMLLISSYSLPMAVSKLVSARLSLKQFKNVRQVFLISLLFGAALGLAAALLMFFGAGFLADRMMNTPRAVLAVQILAPTVFIMGMLGVLRGFFQGHGTMIPTAISQILEQIVHVGVSILAARILFNKAASLELSAENMTPEAYGAAGATIGTGVGALFALLFVGFCFVLYRKILDRRCAKDRTASTEAPLGTLKIIFLTALPILTSAAIANLETLLDHAIFGAYMGEAQDLYETVWGAYSGKFIVLINVPIAISTALAASTLPVISSRMAVNDQDGALQKASAAIRFILLIALPASVGLTVLGRPCLDLLFRSGNNELAGGLMTAGAFGVLGFCVSYVLVGVLQGGGYFWDPILNYVISLAIHVPLLLLCLFVFKWDIYAVAVCNMLYGFVSCLLHFRSLRRRFGYRQEIRRSILLVLSASLIMGGTAFGLYKLFSALHLGNSVSLLGAIFLSVLVYFAAVFLLGALGEEDLAEMPKGAAIAGLARKLHLLR
ncbi:MAG: polysaccharide biosynthesis protein [Lachnospiraceae bacterium]|nr:polysaccharide biosynthesis protein [Lachnospiraceae bacterium]